MTASDFDYVSTRTKIIERAFRIVGALSLYNPLTADQIAQGIQILQDLIKAWQTQHLFLWTYNQLSFATVIAQVNYSATLSTELIGIDKAWVVNSSYDIPIEVVSWSRYNDIRDKALAGRPWVIAVQPTNVPTAYLWPVPDAVYAIKYLAVTRLKDFDSASGFGDFPVRFTRALVYGLANDLYDEYPGSAADRQMIAQKAAESFRLAKNSDKERETDNSVDGYYPRERH